LSSGTPALNPINHTAVSAAHDVTSIHIR